MKTLVQLIVLGLAGWALLVGLFGCASIQRKLLFHPTHDENHGPLSEWKEDGVLFGYGREVPEPENIWLMFHGNGGQASGRGYVLGRVSPRDSFYVLEYPGYGLREGSLSQESINEAALAGFDRLAARYPDKRIGVLGESIGSGPACHVAGSRPRVAKLVLAVPFNELAGVAKSHFPYLPAKLLLRDNWKNAEALKGFRGEVVIYAASNDQVIPNKLAQSLLESVTQAKYFEFAGGHNDWPYAPIVKVAFDSAP